MAATYRALHAKAARQAQVRSRAHERLRNILTGAVIVAALIAAAVWGGGGALSGIRPVQRLRRVGTNAQGQPVYSE
jgi:hypothetical protein